MSELQSLALYILVFLVSTIFIYASGNKRYSKHLSFVFAVVGITIPAIMAGIRYGVGLDYSVYLEIYNGSVARPLGDILIKSGGSEVLFEALANVTGAIFHNPIPFFTLYSMLTLGFFYAGIAKMRVRYPWLLYLLFVLVIFPMSLNIMRQALAISLVFFAISLVLNKQKIKGYFAILFAMTSHLSAVIAIPLVLMSSLWLRMRNKLSSARGIFIKYVFFIFSFGLVFYLSIPVLLSGGNDKYSDLYGAGGYYSESEASFSRIIIKLLIVAIIIAFASRLRKVVRNFDVVLLFALAEVMLLALAVTSAPISRIALYLSPFSLVILSSMPAIFTSGWSRRLAVIGVILFGLLYFVGLFYIGGGSGIFPYRLWTGEVN